MPLITGGLGGSGGGGISSATTPTTYTAASFGGNSYRTITTTSIIAYVKHGTDYIQSFTYSQVGSTLTLDLGFTPTQPVTVGYYN